MGKSFWPLVVAACAVLRLAAAEAAAAPPSRAVQATRAMLPSFYNATSQHLRAEWPGPASAAYWNEAQWVSSMTEVLASPGGNDTAISTALLGVIAGRNQSRAGWWRDYNDDMNWYALALLRAATVAPAHADSYQRMARALFDRVMQAWDESCCGAWPGGVWWDTQHSQKATASNAPAVVTAAMLFELTRNESYLSFATKVFQYWNATMVNATTGQVIDHINRDGSRVNWEFTYNEGAMVGAATSLASLVKRHALLGTPTAEDYLAVAKRCAAFFCTNYETSTPIGLVMHDGCESGQGCCDCQQFKSIGFRYLVKYVQEFGSSAPVECAPLLRNSSEAVWIYARRPTDGLFGTKWAGPAPLQNATVDIASQSAAMTALALAA